MKRIIAVTALAVSLAAGSFAGGTWWAHRSARARERARCDRLHLPDAPGIPQRPSWQLPDLRHASNRGWSRSGNGRPCRRRARCRKAPCTSVPTSSRRSASGLASSPGARGTRLLRTTGRVAPDENRTYPIVAAVSGWIRNVENVATGDAVKRDQVLASFVAPEVEFRSAQQSYYTGLEAFYRMAVTQPQPQPQSQSRSHAAGGGGAGAIDRMADELRIMGVSNSQLREMAAAPRARAGHPRGVAGGRHRAEAQRLAGPPVRSRLRVLPDRGSQPRVDSGRRVPPPAAVHPPRRLRADHHGGREPRSVGDGESVGTDSSTRRR